MRDIFIEINEWEVSIIMILGFALFILFLFIFLNSTSDEEKKTSFQIHIFSENSLKLFFLSIIVIFIFIPPIMPNNTIIIWELIPPLNYVKAILLTLSLAFLPGSNFYSIFFQNDEISKRIKIEPFLIKITLYPLISFSFIGIVVLIYDQIGLTGEYIGILLVIIIFLVNLFDIYLQKRRLCYFKIRKIKLEISKNTFFILLFAIAVMTISVGYQLGWKYLVSGDPWDSIKYANQIGVNGSSPIYINFYPNFWGYISYGLSVLAGIPYININTLLAPFCYLFVTSIYILIKSILFNF
ncbi:MAG: hypothetical protein ACFFBF_10745, partial [Promethearchaeota archaeon]